MVVLVASVACVCCLLDRADTKLSAGQPLCGGLCGMKTLELHFPMIQFLIKGNITIAIEIFLKHSLRRTEEESFQIH